MSGYAPYTDHTYKLNEIHGMIQPISTRPQRTQQGGTGEVVEPVENPGDLDQISRFFRTTLDLIGRAQREELSRTSLLEAQQKTTSAVEALRTKTSTSHQHITISAEVTDSTTTSFTVNIGNGPSFDDGTYTVYLDGIHTYRGDLSDTVNRSGMLLEIKPNGTALDKHPVHQYGTKGTEGAVYIPNENVDQDPENPIISTVQHTKTCPMYLGTYSGSKITRVDFNLTSLGSETANGSTIFSTVSSSDVGLITIQLSFIRTTIV